MAKNTNTVDVNVMDQNIEEMVIDSEPKTKWYKSKKAKIAGVGIGIAGFAGMAIKKLISKRHDDGSNCIIETWDGDERETVFDDDSGAETK